MPSSAATKTLRILLIEDDADVRTVFSDVLTRAGHTVWIAPDGERGLSTLVANRIDLVITDIRMPGMGGSETAALIKGLPKYDQVPIIAVTAYSDEELDGRFHTVLRKPVRAAELLAAVAAVP